MGKIANFPSFLPSYKILRENQKQVYVVEFYHRDVSSEPTVSIVSEIESIFASFDNDPYIAIRFVGGTDVSFSAESYNTNISNDAVVFSSKHDEGTYCLIEFKERE